MKRLVFAWSEYERAIQVDIAWSRFRGRRGPLPHSLRLYLSGSQNHRCCYCGVRTNEDGNPPATIEHIIPVARGGPDVLENLVMCCRPCNVRRGNQRVGEYLAALARKVGDGGSVEE